MSRGGGGLAREAAVTSVQRSDSPPLKVVTPMCVDCRAEEGLEPLLSDRAM